MPSQIEDYAMIGDMRTAALVGRDGAIDWFCAPRFDSAACFSALLGNVENGCWKIAPRRACEVRRHYRRGGLVLETRFENRDGTVAIVDFMPVDEANSSIVRLVIGLEGEVPMETEVVIRFDYGVSVPWVMRLDKETLTAVAGPSMLVLRTPVHMHGANMHTVGRFTAKKGQTTPFVLTYVPSHLKPPAPLDVQAHLARTEAFWQEWGGAATSPGNGRGMCAARW